MKSNIRLYVLCGLFAALTAIGAFIKISIPIFWVAPLTLSTLFIALAGIMLGAKGGALSQIIYVLIGLSGIPVFTKGGGIGYVFEPSFGYLLGFIIGAFIIGKIVELRKKTLLNFFLASIVGLIVIYIVGVAYMTFILNVYMKMNKNVETLIYSGALVYMPGNLISCFVAAVIGVRLKKIVFQQ